MILCWACSLLMEKCSGMYIEPCLIKRVNEYGNQVEYFRVKLELIKDPLYMNLGKPVEYQPHQSKSQNLQLTKAKN